jgi:hypothetical protein
MSKLLLGILITLTTLLPPVVLAQSSSTSLTYQPATIIAVNPHPSPGSSNPDDALYEVSVKVKRTLYVVVTTSPSPSGIIRYAVGREVLVLVGDDTITWNDIMGESHEVPIISRTLITDTSTAQSR